jgi:DNA-directed DNA polymerase
LKREKILLIDGHSILSRAFYGVPFLNNKEGIPTNGIYGFLNILFKEIEVEETEHVAVAFDLPKPTFRHKLFPEYKGTRKGMPEELKQQVPLLQELLQKMNMPLLMMEGFEADDILGTVAKQMQEQGKDVVVVSGDRDLLQLSDEHIKISIPKTSKGETKVYSYYPKDVEEEWGVSPLEFIDLKALMGDSSDNIPGVPGMGEKTATWIIQKYKSIEEAYAHAEDPEFKVPRKPNAGKDLKEHYELAKLSKELATINTKVPITLNFSDCKWENYANPESNDLIRKWEFRSLYSRFEEREKNTEKKLSLPEWKDVEDPYLAKIAFKDAKKQKSAGIFLQKEKANEELYFYLCLSDSRLYRMPLSLCEEELKALLLEGEYFTLQLKDQYHLWEGFLAGKIHDLSLGAYLLNPLKDFYGYDDLARDYMDMVLPGRKEVQNPAEEGLYSAFVSRLAADKIFQELKATEQWELYLDVEEPLVPVLFRMEKAGILVDKEALLSYGEELKKKISALQEEIYAMSGEEFNINSPQQLGLILFEKMQIPGGKKTKTGYSTAVDVLEKLQEDYPIVGKIMEYRTYSKLNSTYAEGLSNYVGEDQRIHGSFQQMVTATGRLSSTEPNLQNIPIRTEMGRVFRSVFIPKEGSVFLDADYSQVELRLLASLSKDEKLIEAYRKDADIHRVTASEVFHVPLDLVTPELRRNAKAVNFGIVYGISAFGLSEGLSISRQEAKEYIERYFATYPKVKEYLDGEVAFAKEHSYVKTLFGRRRPLPEIHASNFMRRSFSERVAMNAPIQGTAADIIKKAMVLVDQRLQEKQCKSRIVLQIHDELLLEVEKEELETVKEILVSAMENVVSLPVPLIVEATVGNNWDEAH